MSIEKKEINEKENTQEIQEIKNPNEIILSTGKKVTKRQRRGQHHIVENRLLSTCAIKGNGNGINVGDLILTTDIKTAVAIGEIDGVKQKIPSSLSEVYELAGEFTYEEWEELKIQLQKEDKNVTEEAKKLLNNTGLDKE